MTMRIFHYKWKEVCLRELFSQNLRHIISHVSILLKQCSWQYLIPVEINFLTQQVDLNIRIYSDIKGSRIGYSSVR